MDTKTKQIAYAVTVFSLVILAMVSIHSLQIKAEDDKTIQLLNKEKEDLYHVIEEKNDRIVQLNNRVNQLADENNSLNQRIDDMRGNLSSRGARGNEIGTVELTAYETGGTCANGMPAQPGVVAVDPDVIPLGSRIYIEVDGMSEYNGVYTAADTGGAVQGNIIDICMESDHFIFGRRSGRAWYVE